MLPSVSQKQFQSLLKLFLNSLDGAFGHFLAGYYLSMHSMLSSMIFLTDNPLDGTLGLIYFCLLFVVVVAAAARVACS